VRYGRGIDKDKAMGIGKARKAKGQGQNKHLYIIYINRLGVRFLIGQLFLSFIHHKQFQRGVFGELNAGGKYVFLSLLLA